MPLQVIHQSQISRLQILDDKGVVDQELEPKLDTETLLKMYRYMLLAREADQRMLKLQRQGRLGTFPPCVGQEASSVGPALAMQKEDWFAGSFRELGGRLALGEPVLNTMRYYNGFEEGNLLPPELRKILPVAVVVGAQTLHAVGLAYAEKLKRQKNAVVCFFGDGATSQGDFHEALNFAAVWKVPVVFVCQNNQWAISVPGKQQTASSSYAQKAIAYGMPGIQVDGNDVLATYQATAEALQRARAGEGPTLIEAVTYRLLMHTTADDPNKYRDANEVELQWQKEPLRRFRTYLEKRGVLDEAGHKKLEQAVLAEVAEAVKQLEEPLQIKAETPFEHVFASKTPELAEQQQVFLEVLQQEAAND